jgi:hypothetical protein
MKVSVLKRIVLFLLISWTFASGGAKLVNAQSIAGLIDGGFEYTKFGGAYSSIDPDARSAFADGAIVFPLGNSLFNVQLDADFNHHRETFHALGLKNSINVWHAGGAVFYRDAAWGLVGVDAALGDIRYPVETHHKRRIGGRGEMYLGSFGSLSARAGYQVIKTTIVDDPGYYINLEAIMYLTPDLAIKPSFEYIRDREFKSKRKFFAYRGEAEFGLDALVNAPFSAFAGGQYYTFQPDGGAISDGTQVYVGLRYYFGSGNTLVDHHRTGTIPNADLIWDKAFFPG